MSAAGPKADPININLRFIETSVFLSFSLLFFSREFYSNTMETKGTLLNCDESEFEEVSSSENEK